MIPYDLITDQIRQVDSNDPAKLQQLLEITNDLINSSEMHETVEDAIRTRSIHNRKLELKMRQSDGFLDLAAFK